MSDDLIKDATETALSILPTAVRDKAIRVAEEILHDPVIRASVDLAKLLPKVVDAVARVIAEAQADSLPETTVATSVEHVVHDSPATD